MARSACPCRTRGPPSLAAPPPPPAAASAVIWGWVDVGGERGLLVVVRRRLLGDATSGLGSGGGSSGGVRLLLTVEGLHVASAAPCHGSGDLSPADGAAGGAGLVVEDDGNGLECGSRGVGLVDLD